jgi:hypothetical protein
MTKQTSSTTCKPHPDCSLCRGTGMDKVRRYVITTFGDGPTTMAYQHSIPGRGIVACEVQSAAPPK